MTDAATEEAMAAEVALTWLHDTSGRDKLVRVRWDANGGRWVGELADSGHPRNTMRESNGLPRVLPPGGSQDAKFPLGDNSVERLLVMLSTQESIVIDSVLDEMLRVLHPEGTVAVALVNPYLNKRSLSFLRTAWRIMRCGHLVDRMRARGVQDIRSYYLRAVAPGSYSVVPTARAAALAAETIQGGGAPKPFLRQLILRTGLGALLFTSLIVVGRREFRNH